MIKYHYGVKLDTEAPGTTAIGVRDFRTREMYFRGYMETLYRTAQGKFFLCGIGGWASPYYKKNPKHYRCSGSHLVLLTDDQARQWIGDDSEMLEKAGL